MKNIIVVLVLFCISVPLVYSQNKTSFDFLNRTLEQTGIITDKSFKRLSSGTLLWTDDPASLAIYEKVKSHIDFLSVNIRNDQDIVSYYQTKDGYLEQFISSLQRIRELILIKSNGIYSSDDIEIIQSEIYNYYHGIIKTISWAQFNTKPLFSSWTDDDEILNRFKEAEFYTIGGLDRILKSVLSERARQGALINTLSYRSNGFSNESGNYNTFLSQGDINFDNEISNLKKSEIMFFSNLFLLQLQKQD